MIEELHVFGIYMPAALVWAVLAGLIVYGVRNLVLRLPLHELLWHPGLIELALFVWAWWGLTYCGDRFLPRWLIS
jgi:hypothetical protein